MMTLERLNALPTPEFVTALSTIFEHSPWVPERVAGTRPFSNTLVLLDALCDAVRQSGEVQQLELIRAHPELAGRAAVRAELTAASTREQQGAGLSSCTADEFAQLQALNTEYGARFGFPFVLAVKGHTPASVIDALRVRVGHSSAVELDVALTEICRIARFRLADLVAEPIGTAIVAMADDLSRFSDQEGGLTCAYLTPAHRATADRIRDFMLAAGLTLHRDAVGNVVGVLPGNGRATQRLLTGSHYDTVTNAGRYDGRLGVLLPIAVAGALRRAGVQLDYPLEIIAFAEEEGVRFKSTFLGSRAVVGRFDVAALDHTDADGTSMREALAGAGSDAADIPGIARDPATVAAFVEVHIEQGPVLLDAGHAVGVVTGIAGSLRSLVIVEGLSGHSGTVPMSLRHDAAAAAAEIVLAVERRCSREPGLVGTVGQLTVPDGAVNVIPGLCRLSIDIRSGEDALRDAAAADLSEEFAEIAQRRGVTLKQQRILEVSAVPCNIALQDAWSESVARVTAAPAMHLPSGAGHDAMMMANLTPIGMLFVRCGNGGISHHPAETLAPDDAEVAAHVFHDFLKHFKVSV